MGVQSPSTLATLCKDVQERGSLALIVTHKRKIIFVHPVKIMCQLHYRNKTQDY